MAENDQRIRGDEERKKVRYSWKLAFELTMAFTYPLIIASVIVATYVFGARQRNNN